MLIYMLQMSLDVMYVWQSVCLLTFLPKLDRGISLVLEEISCFGSFGGIPDMLVHLVPINSEFNCVSVSLVVGTLFY